MDEPNHKKFILYLIVIIIILSVVFGLLYYYFKIFERDKTKLTPEQEIKIQEEVAEIIKTNNFEKCAEIENEIYKTACLNNIALNLAQEKQDISYCQKIDNKLMSLASCERRVLFKKSLDQGHISICNEATNAEIQKECKDRFWPFLAIKEGNIDLCDNVLLEDDKNFCMDNYIFEQEFIKNENNFDCQKFHSQQAKADCQIYLKNEADNCYIFASDLFTNYCLLKTAK